MLVKDYDLGFTFEVNNEFTELSKAKYDLFDVPKDTLHYFIYLDDDDNEYPFAITKGPKCADETAYEQAIIADGQKLKDENEGATVYDLATIRMQDDRRIDRMTVEYDGTMYAKYYTYIGGYMVTAAVEIDKACDENEEGLYLLFASIAPIV